MRTEVEQVPERMQAAFSRTVYFSNDNIKYLSEKEALDRDQELVRRELVRIWPSIDTVAFTGYLVKNQEECNDLARAKHEKEHAVEIFPSLVWWEYNDNGGDWFESIPLLDFYNELGRLLND